MWPFRKITSIVVDNGTSKFTRVWLKKKIYYSGAVDTNFLIFETQRFPVISQRLDTNWTSQKTNSLLLRQCCEKNDHDAKLWIFDTKPSIKSENLLTEDWSERLDKIYTLGLPFLACFQSKLVEFPVIFPSYSSVVYKYVPYAFLRPFCRVSQI